MYSAKQAPLVLEVAPTQYGNVLASVYISFAFGSQHQTFFSISNMGSQPSTSHDRVSKAERGDIRCGPRTPDEASTKPEDTDDSWPNFWDKAECLPHKDGKSIIIWESNDTSDYPNPRVRAGWPLIRLRQAYELLGGDHPRIVRYVELRSRNSLHRLQE
jgi:hypothetical protein